MEPVADVEVLDVRSRFGILSEGTAEEHLEVSHQVRVRQFDERRCPGLDPAEVVDGHRCEHLQCDRSAISPFTRAEDEAFTS